MGKLIKTAIPLDSAPAARPEESLGDYIDSYKNELKKRKEDSKRNDDGDDGGDDGGDGSKVTKKTGNSSVYVTLDGKQIKADSDQYVLVNGDIVLYTDRRKNYISKGRDLETGIGNGSIFVKDIKDKTSSGYDLVWKTSDTHKLTVVETGHTTKIDNGNPIKVLFHKVSNPIERFRTNDITFIIYNTSQIDGDAQKDLILQGVEDLPEVQAAMEEKRLYSLITAWPGDPSVPRASEWGEKYCIIVPDVKQRTRKMASRVVDKYLSSVIKKGSPRK